MQRKKKSRIKAAAWRPLILHVCAADPPSSAAGRTLTLVAKSVQNLANLVEFGAKVGFTRDVSLSGKKL